mmetsp:Transcript_25384/g.75006  ORF Transcript_25384/g.75006 Transcript_25384/m.75006 type:complete len:154 (-) Transcript_25384:331-792(-)
MEQHLAASDKVKSLESENLELKSVMGALKTQLEEIKERSVISNGAELTAFKDKYYMPPHARSVCSDVDFGKQDVQSVDGARSVMGMATRKKETGLNQLFAWANKIAENMSPVPSQPATPRGTRNTSLGGSAQGDVVALLNGFGGNGSGSTMQF